MENADSELSPLEQFVKNNRGDKIMKGYYHYVEDVLNGKIVVGELIKLAC